jgi:hypothetical protein
VQRWPRAPSWGAWWGRLHGRRRRNVSAVRALDEMGGEFGGRRRTANMVTTVTYGLCREIHGGLNILCVRCKNEVEKGMGKDEWPEEITRVAGLQPQPHAL